MMTDDRIVGVESLASQQQTHTHKKDRAGIGRAAVGRRKAHKNKNNIFRHFSISKPKKKISKKGKQRASFNIVSNWLRLIIQSKVCFSLIDIQLLLFFKVNISSCPVSSWNGWNALQFFFQLVCIQMDVNLGVISYLKEKKTKINGAVYLKYIQIRG